MGRSRNDDGQRKTMREEDTVVHTTVKAQLTTYYSIYCPEKVDNIDKILKLFNGRYDVLNEKLQRKYGKGFYDIDADNDESLSFDNNINFNNRCHVNNINKRHSLLSIHHNTKSSWDELSINSSSLSVSSSLTLRRRTSIGSSLGGKLKSGKAIFRSAAAAAVGIKRSSSNPDDSNSIQSIQSNKIVKVANNYILETNSNNSQIEYDEYLSLLNENTNKDKMSKHDDVNDSVPLKVGHCKNDHDDNADGVDETERLIQYNGRVIINAEPSKDSYDVSANTSIGAAMKNDEEDDVKSKIEQQQVISDEIQVSPGSTVLLDHTNTQLLSPFGLSIRENMLYGVDREVSQEELESASKDANAHDFISEMTDGYDTILILENDTAHPASSVTGEELMKQFSSVIGPSPSKMKDTPSKLPNMDISLNSTHDASYEDEEENDDGIADDNDNSSSNGNTRAPRPHWCNLTEIPVVHIAGTPPDPLSSLKKQIRDQKLKAIASSELSIDSEGTDNMNEHLSSLSDIVDMQHCPIPSLTQNESNTSSTQAATTVSGMDCVSQYSSMKSPSPMKMDHFAFDVSMDTSIDINDSILDDKNDATYLDNVDPCNDDAINTNENALFDGDDGSICQQMRVSHPRRSPRQSNDVVNTKHMKFKHPSTTKLSHLRMQNNNKHDSTSILQKEYNVDHSCSTPLERLTRDIGNTLRQWRIHQGCDWHVSLDWADKMDSNDDHIDEETSDIEDELSDNCDRDEGDAQQSIKREMGITKRPIQFMSMDMCERGFLNRTRAIQSWMGDENANNMQTKTPQAPSPPSPEKRPRVPRTIITPLKELPSMCTARKIKRGDCAHGAQCIRSQKIIFHTVGYTSEQIDDSVTLNRRRYTIPLLLKLWDAPYLPLDASSGTENAVPRSLQPNMYSSSFSLTGEYGILSPCGTSRMYYSSSSTDASNDSSVEPAAGLMRDMSALFNIGQHITLCLDLSEGKTDTDNNDIESLFNDLRYCIERNISEALEYQERKLRERRHRHHTRLESAQPDRHHLIGKNLNEDDDASTVGDGSEYSESEDSDCDYPPKYDLSIDQNEIHAEVTASLTTLLQTAINLAASENKCCIPVFGIWGTYNGDSVNTDRREKWKVKGLQRNLLQIRESCNIRQVENDEGSSTDLLLSSPAISGMCLSGTFQSTHRLYYIPEQALPFHLTTLNGLAKVLLTQCPSFDGSVVLAAARHLYHWEQRDMNGGHDVSPMRNRNQNWRTLSFPSVGETSPVEIYREQCQQQAYQILERACSPKIYRPEPLWGPSKGNPLVSLSATVTWGTIPSQDDTSIQPPPLLQLPLKIRSSNFASTPSELLDLEYSLQSAALNPIGMGVVENERGHYEFGPREPIFLASAAFDADAPCATLSANTRCVLAALLRCGSLGLDTLPGHLTKTKIVAKFSTPSKTQMAGESTEDSSNTDYILRKALDAAKVGPVTKRLIDALDWGEVDMKLSAADFDRATNEALRRIQSTSYPAPPEEVFWNSKLQVQSHEHLSQSKGSPPGRLLSILFAHMSRMRTPPSMCRMWLSFVEELRSRWDGNESLPNLGLNPGLDCIGNAGKSQWGFKGGTPVLGHRANLAAFVNSSEPDPDRDHCIINQMLQVYNICIECKISIDALYNKKNNTGVNDSILSNSTVNSAATENRSSEDDDFFDPEEEEVAFDGNLDGIEKKQDIERMLKEAAITTPSHNRIGARCPVPDAMPLIKSGDQLYAPYLQRTMPMTDEEEQKQKKIMGSNEEADHRPSIKSRIAIAQRLQKPKLLSDMSSFKAANHGAVFEDFVRWYGNPENPLNEDVNGETARRAIERRSKLPPEEAKALALEEASEAIAILMSLRAFWEDTWEEAEPCPAIDQDPLFDPNSTVEMLLHSFETIHPALLLNQVLSVTLTNVKFVLIERAAGPATPVRSVASALATLEVAIDAALQMLTEDASNGFLHLTPEHMSDNSGPLAYVSMSTITKCEVTCDLIGDMEILLSRALTLLEVLPGEYELIDSLLQCKDGQYRFLKDPRQRSALLQAIKRNQVFGCTPTPDAIPVMREYVLQNLDPSNPCQLSARLVPNLKGGQSASIHESLLLAITRSSHG